MEGKGNLFQWKGNPTVLLTARDITETKIKEISMQEETAYLRRENVTLRSSIKDRYRFGDIIGKSAAIQEVYERSPQLGGNKCQCHNLWRVRYWQGACG